MANTCFLVDHWVGPNEKIDRPSIRYPDKRQNLLPTLPSDHSPIRYQVLNLGIEQYLDQLPPTYTADVYQQKCNMTYQHIYDAYFGQGRSVYASRA